MSALVHCKGNTCRSPYALLHPGQNVMSFTQVRSRVRVRKDTALQVQAHMGRWCREPRVTAKL